MRDGLDAGQAAAAVPRSTLYRWAKAPEPRSRRPHRVRANGWSPALRIATERLRLDFPMWGKDKLGPLLRKAGFTVSNATVGRILKSLVERGRVRSVPDRKTGRKSPSKARPHAIRKPKDVEFKAPGDVIQIDTLTLDIAPGRTVKHFDAYDVFAKWTVAKPYKSATAANAADFLAKVTAEMPWPIKAIQIDGGSEFMAEFETACRDRKIPLYVLPPRSPKLTDVIDKSLFDVSALLSCCARTTAWRRAGCEVRALPRSLYRRASFAASVRAFFGPLGFQPATKRA
jgi:putative transposase